MHHSALTNTERPLGHRKQYKKINAIKHTLCKTIVRDESQCHSTVPFFVLSGVGEFKWRFLKQRIRDFFYKLN